MISIGEAVNAAKAFTAEIYAEGELKAPRVEEIQFSDGETKAWLVTLGWIEPGRTQVGGVLALSGRSDISALPRVYKVLRVDADTGEVKDMKIRNV